MTEGSSAIEPEEHGKSKKNYIIPIACGVAAIAVGAGIMIHSSGEKNYASAPLPAKTFSTHDVSKAAPLSVVKALKNPDDESCADSDSAYKGDPGTNLSKTLSKADKEANSKYGGKDSASQTIMSMSKCANRLYVPQIGSYTSVVPEFTTTINNTSFINIPTQLWRTGFFAGTQQLSSKIGNTLIVGHVDLDGIAGPFAHLSELKPGALIYTSDEKKHVQAWRVQSLNTYDKLHLPDSVTTGAAKSRQLTLVTCGGDTGLVKVSANGKYRGFLSNVVVTAAPVSS